MTTSPTQDLVRATWHAIYIKHRSGAARPIVYYTAELTLRHGDGWKHVYTLRADTMRALYYAADSHMRRIRWKNPRTFSHSAFEVIS